MPHLKHRKGSRAWVHYIPVEGGKAKCNHCDKVVVVANGSTGNLFRHMKLKHPSIPVDKGGTSKIPVAPTADNESPHVIVNTTTELQQVMSPDSVKFDNVTDKSSQQPTFYVLQSYSNENERPELDRQLLRMVVKELLPFSIVEGQEFVKFVNMLNPSYVLPSRKTLSNDILNQMYEIVLENVRSTLKEATSVTLTTDRWVSHDKQNFIAVTAYYLDKDLELKSSLLECFAFHNQSPADIALFLQELTADWGISNKILAIVSDGAEFLVNAIDSCQWNHIPCFAHILNDVVETGLVDISSFISKVRNVVYYFKRNSTVLNKFHVTQNQMGLCNLKLKKDTLSMWDTTFEMLTTVLKNKIPLLSTIEQLQLHSFKLTSADFIFLEKAVKMLIIFNSIKVEMCSEETIALSKISHMIRFVSKYLANILEDTELHPDIVKMGNTLKNGLKQFEVLEGNGLVRQSVLLDPRFKKRGFSDAYFAEACVTLRNNVISVRESITKEKFEDTEDASVMAESTLESEYFMDMWSEFETKVPPPQQNLSAAASVEVDAYLNDVYLPMESNPLIYWANIANQNKFPALFELAKRILCIPATVVPCQRMYSKAGNIFLKKRCHLPASKLGKILFLHHNL